jgi:MFS family permease
MLYGGVVSDRVPRRTLLVTTQTAMMLLAFILAGLTFAGWVQPWHLIVLAFLLGVANAFDAPARQAFVLEMVEREDLANAIALNSTMFNSATAVGPAVAGITYAALGPAWCFTINGLSFIAVILALLLMRLKPRLARTRATSAFADLKEGLGYVARHSIIRTLILVVAMVSLFGMGYATLLPAWSVTVLQGNATTLGFLQSARGVGALLAALWIASLGRFNFKGRLFTLGSFVYPIFLLVFASIRWLPFSLLVLAGVGWGFMIVLNMANSLVQTHVSYELRGRVMGIYTIGFFGMMPLSALLAGGVAEAIGAPITVALSALLMLLFAAWLWLRVPQLRGVE